MMLLAFYKNVLPESVICTLSNMRTVSTSARKAFRMLKSVNHVTNIMNIAEEDVALDNQQLILNLIKVLEQVFWVS